MKKIIVLLTGALMLGYAPASAQQLGEADFLFEQPTFNFNLRFGGAFPRAESQIFDDVFSDLTLDKEDFYGIAVGGELGIRITERFDLSVGLHHSESTSQSEFRDFVEDNDLPIFQTTEFKRTPFTVSGKVYLADRGTKVGSFAWIPNTFAPYIGAGGGFVSYVFEQEGDFVDFDTLEIFSGRFRSSDVGPTAHVMAGADVSVGSRFFVNVEGRYAWANAEMDDEGFVGFDDIDLDGMQATVGFGVRF